MKVKRELEQHIAVFGESGSGKTVLLSSFYGPTQEKGFTAQNLFSVVPDSQAQGITLYKNYVGMRDSRDLPETTTLRSTAYGFTLKMGVAAGTSNADTMKVVWHDYPGEWFGQDLAGELAQRRVDAFRDLMRSDVALLLVDAQRLIDNAGHEEAYLKSLFYNFRDGLERLRSEILTDGRPLERFPRIWMIALSKTDLLPDIDVRGFRDLVLGKAGSDVLQLRDVIASYVQAPDALSVGADFLLLSSARFTPEKIDLADRVGLDLILPIASVLPVERLAKWAGAKQLPAALAKQLLQGAGGVVSVLGNLLGLLAKVPKLKVLGAIVALIPAEAIEQFAEMGTDKLEEIEREAKAKKEFLVAALARFRLELDEGEAKDVLLRSQT
ncbi:TRAFAC clade GTPase domain-containing protein [Microbacterium rhizophilus]|uniref:TRAFAC clade GTPase domain-containing protein n=1 Tax=Microbacterium rhizophilus TaxID=3138934 RepID=UPI0031E9F023